MQLRPTFNQLVGVSYCERYSSEQFHNCNVCSQISRLLLIHVVGQADGVLAYLAAPEFLPSITCRLCPLGHTGGVSYNLYIFELCYMKTVFLLEYSECLSALSFSASLLSS